MNNLINTRVSVFRNIKNYKFAPKLSSKDKDEIIETLLSALGEKFEFVKSSNLDLKSNDLRGLIKESKDNLIVSDTEKVVIDLFNTEVVEIKSESVDAKLAYDRVKAVADRIADKIELAYNDDYGYLMSDVIKLGSGYRFKADLNLMAIKELNKINQLKQNIEKLGYTLEETAYDSIYTISSLCNLGYSERQVFEDFEKMINKIDALEVESAKMLDLTSHDEIEDRVCRSLAVLKSCHLINQDELFNRLNDLRLGLDLNIINIDLKLINEMQKLIEETSEFTSKDQSKGLANKVNLLLKGE